MDPVFRIPYSITPGSRVRHGPGVIPGPELRAAGGAVLVAAHDRAFIDRFATGIWALEGGSLRPYLDRAEMARASKDAARIG